MLLPQPATFLKEKFGYDHFRAGQKQAIERIMTGKSTEYLDVPVKLIRIITVLAMLFGLFFFASKGDGD